jgi:hypothetical protein
MPLLVMCAISLSAHANIPGKSDEVGAWDDLFCHGRYYFKYLCELRRSEVKNKWEYI